VLVCVSAVVCPQPLPSWITAAVLGVGTGLVGTLALFLALPRLDSEHGLVGWLAHRSGAFRQLVEVVRLYSSRPAMLLGSLLLSVPVQAASIVLVWFNARAVGLSPDLVSLGVVMPLVTLVTLLPISVNGVGLREFCTIILLAPLGVDATGAASLSILNFASQALVSLAGLIFLFGRFPRAQAAGPVISGRVGWEGARHEDAVRGHSHQGRAGQPPAAA
jgi:hypothetical protein